MTVPEQRTLAVLQTRVFLEELAASGPRDGVPGHVSREASRLLRHYPSPSNIQATHLLAPIFFGPVNTPAR